MPNSILRRLAASLLQFVGKQDRTRSQNWDPSWPNPFRSPAVLGSAGPGTMYWVFYDAEGNPVWAPRDWVFLRDAEGNLQQKERRYTVRFDALGRRQYWTVWYDDQNQLQWIECRDPDLWVPRYEMASPLPVVEAANSQPWLRQSFQCSPGDLDSLFIPKNPWRV